MPQHPEYYIHNQSDAVYRITAVEGARVYYRRLGDGLERNLPSERFSNRFRAANEQEAASISEVASLADQQGHPLTLGYTERLRQFLDGGAEEGQERGTPPPPDERHADASQAEVGILTDTTERDNFDNLTLYPETRESIDDGVRQILMREQLEQAWGLSEIMPMAGRCILNFYGAAGTGKTRAAKAIAHSLNKPLYQVDYASIVSKYYGDTAKHIRAAFHRARDHSAVLFFDEADSLLSKRVDLSESGATSINQNRNTLMQELDRFDGVVIMTTNLFKNYDEALLRRVSAHVAFKLPNESMRAEIFKSHIPDAAMERVAEDVDWGLLAAQTKGFSGGDILNVCTSSIIASSRSDNPEEWVLTVEALEREVAKVKQAKHDHKPVKKKMPMRVSDN